MNRNSTLTVLLVLCLVVGGVVYLWLPDRDTAQAWELRRQRLRQAALNAQPLIEAVTVYSSGTGQPPAALADVIPAHLDKLPDTGIRQCGRYEYRSLAHKQGSIIWYDLGSRQGEPRSGASHYSDGDPGHAILVFTLDATQQVSSAEIERLPKGHEAVEFDPQRWQAGGDRIGMALAFAETYRLYGMPRDVVEELLGSPDGSRLVRNAPWELRLNCPTGLFNHDSLVYWPGGGYPQYLYGGVTETIGDWAYVHSRAFTR